MSSNHIEQKHLNTLSNKSGKRRSKAESLTQGTSPSAKAESAQMLIRTKWFWFKKKKKKNDEDLVIQEGFKGMWYWTGSDTQVESRQKQGEHVVKDSVFHLALKHYSRNEHSLSARCWGARSEHEYLRMRVTKTTESFNKILNPLIIEKDTHPSKPILSKTDWQRLEHFGQREQ